MMDEATYKVILECGEDVMWKPYRHALCAYLPDGLVDVMFSDGDIRTAKNVNWYTPYKSCGSQRIFIIAWRESE